jgi:predicted Rossmann fold nucleotide-binding protein DprA/Smf involved in DNA uptake
MIQPTRRKLQRIDTVAGPVETVGAAVLLQREKLGLICSRKCPGDIIVKTYEFARLVRGSSLAILSGFHSPIEKDCLPILLRTQGPIIIALGHRLNSSRLPMDWQKAMDVGRLLLVSQFSDKDKRVTAELAEVRNRFVGTISDVVLIPYAAPDSKTEALAINLLESGKRVYTCGRPGALLDSGARVVEPNFLTPSRGSISMNEIPKRLLEIAQQLKDGQAPQKT